MGGGDMLINCPCDVVNEMLEGLIAVTPNLALLDALDRDVKVVCVHPYHKKVVAVISGGGSGHEPAHAGYVGEGMLAAAVCGDVFASPSTEAILCAIRAVSGSAGCLLVVKNYTGDRLNFGMAAEQAKAEGIPVMMVIVGDDYGVQTDGTATGRRGIAGTVFVHKVAGAAAAAGKSLEEVHAIASRAAERAASIGAALSTCTLPGATPSQRIAPGMMELGLGIHGEPGAKQCAVASVDELVPSMINTLLKDTVFAGAELADCRAALLVNNLGASTTMEMMIVARRALAYLKEKGVRVERVMVGTYMSALDMSGMSLSLLMLDDQALELLDAPTAAVAWPKTLPVPECDKARVPVPPQQQPEASGRANVQSDAGRALRRCIEACAHAAIAAEPELTAADTKVGDGDCGTTFKRGGEAVLAVLDCLPCDDPAATMLALAAAVGRNMGGTSGALYQIFFTAAATALTSKAEGQSALSCWVGALTAGKEAISKYGGAKEGDRTMLDALGPAESAAVAGAKEGKTAPELVALMADAAQKGSQETAGMRARAGRSSYASADAVKGTCDPGALGVAALISAIASALKQSA